MSLYLKYRPQDFKTVVGQNHVVTTVQNALKHDALVHAYLFAGPRGTGKTSLARIIAKALNCLELKKEDCEPCNTCSICESINNGRLVDMIEIDAASNRGIDEIRELREKIVFAPSQAKAKIYIIDEVHMLTKEAFNALLKTLEEPPTHAYFILATTEAHKIPETIISRCQQFNFKRIGVEETVKRLQDIAAQENIEAETEALNLIAKISNGGLRDAIGLFEQMNTDSKIQYEQVAKNLGLSESILINSFFEALLNKDTLKAIEIINQVNAKGQNLHQFTGELISFLREQMLLSVQNAKDDPQSIIELIDIFSYAKLQINQALIPQLPLEIAVIKACQYETEAQPTKSEVKKEKAEKKVEKKIEKREASSDTKVSPSKESAIITPLKLEEIKDKWQRIVEHIDTPFIRMAFLDSEPIKFEKGTLTLAFKSDTLMEKIVNPKNQNIVLNALEKVFETKISLNLEMKKVDLKPMINKTKESDDPSVVDMAKEVFGI